MPSHDTPLSLAIFDPQGQTNTWRQVLSPTYTARLVKTTEELAPHDHVLCRVRRHHPFTRPAVASVLWILDSDDAATAHAIGPHDRVMIAPLRPAALHALLTEWLQESAPSSWVAIGPLSYAPHLRLLRHGDKTLDLTEKEALLLEQLLSDSCSHTRDHLLAKVWGYRPQIETRTLESHIHRLRRKIYDLGAPSDLIETTPDGYRLRFDTSPT